MAAKITFEQYWHSKTDGQQLALGKKLFEGAGGNAEALENFEGLVRDELTAEIVFKDATVVLVDRNGRCIPTGVSGKVIDANRDFRLVQPEIDYAARLDRFKGLCPDTMVFPTAQEFQTRVEAILEEIRSNWQITNLLRGVWLPIVLPQLKVADYGTVLEETFLTAVKASYERQFSGRTFYNYRAGEFAGKVSVIEGTRHHQLLARMAEGPVVAVYFATALQGFGITADREQIRALPLPGSCILSGAIDIATAMTMYPDVLGLNWNTPGLDAAANQWWKPAYSLYFLAGDGRLVFGSRCLGAYDRHSGGLSFVGSVCG
jgi:hypothetical protein